MHTQSIVYLASRIQRANIGQLDMQVQDERTLLTELADSSKCSQQMKLVKEIAILRLIIAKKKPKMVKQLIRILSEQSAKINQEKQLSDKKINDFFLNQRYIIDEELAHSFERSLLLALKARQVLFRKIFEDKDAQKYAIKIQERPFNHLLEMLKFNHEYSQICGGQPDFVPLTQLAEIFQCNTVEIEHFKHVYLDNRTRITMNHICPQHSFIFMLIFAKLKTEISKGLTKLPFPTEFQIQSQMSQILFLYKELDQASKQNDQLKVSFAQLCAKENKLSDFNINLRTHILKKVEEIMQQTESRQQQQLEMERICSLYRIRKQQLLIQLKKNRNANIQEKVHQIVCEIYHARYTGQYQSLKNMVSTFYRKYGKTLDGVLQFIGTHCQKEIRQMKQLQERNLGSILSYSLKLIMEQEEVAFIDFQPYYKKQFNSYNVFMNRADLVTKYKTFTPAEDVVFFLVTCITNKRIILHSLIMQNLTVLGYINCLKEIFDMGYSKMPNKLALFMPFRLKNFQWKKLSDLIAYIENRGFLVFLLPNSQGIPNVNAFVADLLRNRLLNECSQYLNEQKMQQWKRILQTSVQKFMFSPQLRRKINVFMKQNWKK